MNKSVELGKRVFDLLIRPDDGDFVDNTFALVYAHTDQGIKNLGHNGDVYRLLENLVIPKGTEGLSIVTTGFAAPLDKNGRADGAPSKHPERRRVRLIISVTQDDTGSVLEFADNLEVIEDEGDATGSLSDALIDAWKKNPVLSW